MSYRVPLWSLLVGFASAVCSICSAQASGAIYTTDRHGDVDNVFGNKRDVYMAGGPGPNSGCSGNGLADGLYYFQVTDPSGRILLSEQTDINDRIAIVSGGVIIAAPAHATAGGPCGSKVVRLEPFSDTPSSGNEYKVWLTPTSEYAGAGVGFHGFLSAASKTDSFKVQKGKQGDQTLIHGIVFYDVDENNVYDPTVPGEVPIPGWKILIDSGGVITETFTNSDGEYEFLRDLDYSSHVLTSVAPSPGYIGIVGGRWLAIGPTPVTVVADAPEVRVDFGKLYFVNTPELARSKGYWHNQGRYELEVRDPEWRLVVNDLCLRQNFTVSDGYTEEETRFYVSENGSFDQAYQQLSDYLVDSDHGIMAFNLSTQFCAGVLNKNFGALQTTTFIDRYDNDVLVDFYTLQTDTRELLCDPRSGDTGPDGDQEWRDILKEELCANLVAGLCNMFTIEWTGMNSGGSNIYTSSGDLVEFDSPY